MIGVSTDMACVELPMSPLAETAIVAVVATRFSRPSPLLRIAPTAAGPPATIWIAGIAASAAEGSVETSWPRIAVPVVVTEIVWAASMLENTFISSDAEANVTAPDLLEATTGAALVPAAKVTAALARRSSAFTLETLALIASAPPVASSVRVPPDVSVP